MADTNLPAKNGHGGRRVGAGRKPQPATQAGLITFEQLALRLPRCLELIDERLQAGDINVAAGILKTLTPPIKAVSPCITFAMKPDASPQEVQRTLLAAVAAGQMSSTIAAELSTLIDNVDTADKLAELQALIEADHE